MNKIQQNFELWASCRGINLNKAGDTDFYTEVKTAYAWAGYEEAHKAQQATIDRLMLEYCPNEMTQEQKDEWASHQREYFCLFREFGINKV